MLTFPEFEEAVENPQHFFDYEHFCLRVKLFYLEISILYCVAYTLCKESKAPGKAVICLG